MNARNLTKYVIAPALVVLSVLSLVFGEYLPFEKSKQLIISLNQAGNSTTLKDFEDTFNRVFDFYSPIGQPESIRFFGSQITGYLSHEIPIDLSQGLTNYTDKVFQASENSVGFKGLNYTQTQLMLANVHYLNWVNAKNKADFDKTEEYYKEVVKLSPNRPQALYGLFQLYYSNKDVDNTLSMADKILSVWPDNQKLKDIVSPLRQK
ncbi:MAG: tetratricopeptide repeat protein [Minisyncoccia bacterium]